MSNTTTRDQRPSRKWFLLPLFIFLLGPIISLALIISLFTASKHSVTFFVPGTAQIFITKPGTYTLWIENHDWNRAQRAENELPNIALTFIDPKTNKSSTLIPKIGWNSHKGTVSHFSLGTIKFDHPGAYLLTANGQVMTPYKVYLKTPSLPTILTKVAASLLIPLLCIVTALLLSIILVVRRMNSRKVMEPNTSTEPKEPLEQKGAPEQPSSSAITWAMTCHLSGFAGFLFPLANIIAPLLIWGFKRHEFAYVDEQGKEAINFQISVTIYYLVAAILILVLIGFFLLPLIAAFHIIAMIVASVESAHGKYFHYPLTLRFLR